MGSTLKQQTFKGTLWSAVERFGVQGVTFIVMIVMARMLTPDDYGLVGMLTIFIVVAQSLIDAGFSQGLIRKRDVSPEDTSTVFYFNIVASAVLYLVLWLCAPLIADFYDLPQLKELTRVLSLGIVINSFGMVQRALFTIRLDFKTQAKASFTGAIIAGGFGIWMSVAGWGVWALVWYQLINYFLVTAFFWAVSRWRPKAIFSMRSFRELFSYGINIAVSMVIDNIYRNIYLLVIGKWFKADTLGYYTRAQQFGEMPMNINGIIQRVSFPVLCGFKEDDGRLVTMCLKFVRLSAFLTFPLMLGMAAVAEPMIVAILGEKWKFSALLLQIVCLGLMWYPLAGINQNMMQVKGKSGKFLQMEIVKKIVGVIIICITLPMGLIPLCLGQMVNGFLMLVVGCIYTRSEIPLGFLDQMRGILPTFLCSLVMGGAVWGVTMLLPGVWWQLAVGVVTGLLIYFLLSRLFLREEFGEVVALLRRKQA